MKCHSCGFSNASGAKFCASCGVRLAAQKTQGTIRCRHCNSENAASAGFCSNCGREIVGKKKAHPPRQKAQKTKTAKPRFSRLLPFVVAAAIIVLAIFLARHSEESSPSPISPPVQSQAIDPVLLTRINEVVGKFRCSCGQCGGEPLEECTCPTAVSEKEYIAQILRNGVSVELAIARVDSIYGYRIQ